MQQPPRSSGAVTSAVPTSRAMPPPSAARSPLFAALRRAARLAAASAQGGPPPDESVELAREARVARRADARPMLDRRSFLGLAGASVAGTLLGPALAGCAPTARLGAGPGARIAVVGGGMAGLNAAFRLRQAGVRATVYEASPRTGGRMHTATGLLGPGLTTELGGEFIDSTHRDVLALALAFGLDVADRACGGEEDARHAFYFGGRLVPECEVVEAFVPLVPALTRDRAAAEGDGALALDRLSVAEYLDRIGATGLIRDLLDAAYVTEYGLDAGEQSALNLIGLVGLETSDACDRFEPFGDSDERFKVVGGNERVVVELASRLPDAIETGQRLVAMRPRGAGVRLAFESAGATRDVDADVVVLALPFTLLREVDTSAMGWPGIKQRAIRELGYGTNAKLFVGTAARPWRAMGHNGECMTDAAFQLCWDNAQLQPGTAGGLTLFSGGAAGLAVGMGTAEEQVARLLPGVDGAFPGVAGVRTDRVGRFHWPTHPFTRASYACYRPGQTTAFGDAVGAPVGRVHFAGEHCSAEFQGYMNGAAETGRVAAEAVLASLGVNVPR